MRKMGKARGFSLAEMLIVVAIIAVLMGVSFVAVQNHQRSMTRLEFDTIAKEIFIAAQNHLTAAESQGYLNEEINYGNPGTRLADDDSTADIYYVVSGGTDGIKELMLPDYALDATVLSGSFLIRYQPSSATVLDVFYSREGNGTFLTVSGVVLGQSDYSPLMGTEPNYRQGGEKQRENYRGGVIGWYGGAKALPMGERLQAPTFEVINKERLLVKVSIPDIAPVSGYCVKLIVTGKTSGTEAYFTLYDNGAGSGARFSSDEKNTIVLDSVTEQAMQFSKIDPNKGPGFVPGEDLSIKAVAYSKAVLANIAMSAEKTTNSLFADPYPYTAGKEVLGSDLENGVAGIANIRHLENLDPKISKFTPSDFHTSAVNNQGIQLRDLSWTEFITNTNGENTRVYDQSNAATNLTCYYPVSPNYELAYDGDNHKISNVKVKCSGDAGVFGALSGGSVSNLLVLDSNIASSSGAAGGLIGSMKDNTRVEKCAANGIVSSNGPAGGLIGLATSGSVTSCYSAGHTKNGSYQDWLDEEGHEYDVTGVTAGGLIGSSTIMISDCYSTCSVSGTGSAGGFVGNASGGSIGNCYAVGLVATKLVEEQNDHNKNSSAGAFAGAMSVVPSECKYYGIINEVKRTEKKDETSRRTVFDHYLGAVGDAATAVVGITEIDLNTESYEKFVGEPDTWTKAEPNDMALKAYYQEKYNLKGISRLALSSGTQPGGTTNVTEPIVSTHYGDWPAPEIFVINSNG